MDEIEMFIFWIVFALMCFGLVVLNVSQCLERRKMTPEERLEADRDTPEKFWDRMGW